MSHKSRTLSKSHLAIKTREQEEASKAVYIMRVKELLYAISLTAPRKAFLLLQRIEKKRKKREKN